MIGTSIDRFADRFGITRKHVFFIGVVLVLQALDAITTAFGLRSGLREGNGLAALIIANHGELSVYGFKVIATIAIVGSILLLQKRYAKLWLGLRIVAVYMFFVVAFNLVNIALETA